MRRFVTFPCADATLVGTLDEAPGSAGLLIISGGNEIRIGAHRGLAKLAADCAHSGSPVLRFDRRGIGDSQGTNGGFTSSAPDIRAALEAFKAECPAIKTIVAFGNCDGAAALMLHLPDGLSAVILANIWIIQPEDDLPPPAAIKARYLERLRDPKAWLGLFTGAIDLRKLARGLVRLREKKAVSPLAEQVANGLAMFKGPIDIVLAQRDGTALAFMDAWSGDLFKRARARADINLTMIDSNAHSFASIADYEVLRSIIMKALSAA